LIRSKALAHNGMLLMKDQVFKVNLWTRISNPSAHDDLSYESDIIRSLLKFRLNSIDECPWIKELRDLASSQISAQVSIG
jgi:hypothetical protein